MLASLVFVTIALFVYVAVGSPATLVALPPSPSSLPEKTKGNPKMQ
jgi:hypothetical protein